VRNHADPADLHVGYPELLDHLRQEEQQAEARRDNAEIVQGQEQDYGVPERFPKADLALGFDQLALVLERVDEPAALLFGEPMGLVRPVGDEEQEEKPDEDGRDG